VIISHQHKFIFIKTRKTAGTSLEIALSAACGPDDVITPIGEEAIRRTLGYRGPQNCLIPLRSLTGRDWLDLVKRRNRLRYYNHAPARFVRRYCKEWSSYFKFCVERNPWDKAVSSWAWVRKSGKSGLDLPEYIRSGEVCRVQNFDMYSEGGRIVVDKVYRFESLDTGTIGRDLGVELPELPRAKGGVRSGHYRELLGQRERLEIQELFAREIENFGYEF
jgi:hypothetical protein